MTNSHYIKIAIHDGVLTIGLNRPDKKNAINRTMYKTMTNALKQSNVNNEVNCILLHGIEEAFTVGNDIADFNNRNPDELSEGGKFLLALHNLEKPLIAAVSGYAVGIGATMLLHCDLVYAAEDARLRFPFVNLGICPEAGSTLTLPAIAGHLKASELFLFGDFFTAKEAIDFGLINRTVKNADLLEFAKGQAQKMARQPTKAVMATKRFLKQAQYEPVKQRILDELSAFNALLQTEESIKIRQNMLKN